MPEYDNELLDQEHQMKKPVDCKLVGEDGNAFAILGRFRNAAKRAGWTSDEIDEVLKDAMSADYNHLLATIDKWCSGQEPFAQE